MSLRIEPSGLLGVLNGVVGYGPRCVPARVDTRRGAEAQGRGEEGYEVLRDWIQSRGTDFKICRWVR